MLLPHQYLPNKGEKKRFNFDSTYDEIFRRDYGKKNEKVNQIQNRENNIKKKRIKLKNNEDKSPFSYLRNLDNNEFLKTDLYMNKFKNVSNFELLNKESKIINNNKINNYNNDNKEKFNKFLNIINNNSNKKIIY